MDRKNVKNLVSHMLDSGWLVNHKYIEEQSKGEVDLTQLVWGKLNSRYHLISSCGSYVAKIDPRTVHIWQMRNPSSQYIQWQHLIEIPLKEIELVENGVRYKLLEVVVKRKGEKDVSKNEASS